MKQLLLTMALLLTTLVGGVCAQEVFERPETSANWYLTAVYSNPMTPDDVALYKLLREDAGLIKLTEVTHFNEYHDGMAIVNETGWKTYLGTERPALLLQGAARPDGKADNIFFVRGVLTKAKDLVGYLHKAIQRYGIHLALPANVRGQKPWRPFRNPGGGGGCPDGNCPRAPRQPGPGPGPAPLVDPTSPPAVVTPIMPLAPFNIDVLLGPKDDVEVVVEVPPADAVDKLPATPVAEEEGIPLIALLLVAAAGFAGYVSSQKS